MDLRNDATEHTKAANRELFAQLPFDDEQDFEDASRGLIAPLPDDGVIAREGGPTVWDMSRFSFVEEGSEAPETVNPSLWRQSQLVMKGGLFEVVEGMYQVRNADLSNLTIVEGEDGLIVFDPLITVEAARAAMELYYSHRPRRPVVAVVHSHSHVDHFGGVRGIVSQDDIDAGKVKVIAPVGFLEAAVAENVMCGNVMSRRATYMYGNLLPADPKGQVGAGLGMTTSVGTVTLIPPTDEVTETGQKMEIAGLTFEFLLAPDTEAPAEMHWYIEELKALTAAENCCHTLHNTYTLRGAPTRDPQAWSRYLNETIDRWGAKTDVMYGMHHWPVWGSDRVIELLRKGRDGYRYINDQTLRLANHGLTPKEIAEEVELPESLSRHWALRGYYGSVSHNVKGTYDKYLGWYDGNPAHLHELPPEQAATRYVEMMGGAGAVLDKARAAYEQGEYRWVAEVVNHVVFAEPDNAAARTLQADALEQMGYQAESGPWRNNYLSGAQELRHGVADVPTPTTASPDSVRAMSLDLVFNYLAMRIKGPDAGGVEFSISLDFTDTGEQAVLELSNGALNHSLGRLDPDADSTLTLTRSALDRVMLGEAAIDDQVAQGEIEVQGERDTLARLLALLDEFQFWFNIVEP